MPERRFIVLFVERDGKKERFWTREYDTLQEANQGISGTQNQAATGYAIHDRDLHKFIRFKDFAFDDYENEGEE